MATLAERQTVEFGKSEGGRRRTGRAWSCRPFGESRPQQKKDFGFGVWVASKKNAFLERMRAMCAEELGTREAGASSTERRGGQGPRRTSVWLFIGDFVLRIANGKRREENVLCCCCGSVEQKTD